MKAHISNAKSLNGRFALPLGPYKHTLPAKMGYQLVRSVEEDTEDCNVAAGAEKILAIELRHLLNIDQILSIYTCMF